MVRDPPLPATAFDPPSNPSSRSRGRRVAPDDPLLHHRAAPHASRLFPDPSHLAPSEEPGVDSPERGLPPDNGPGIPGGHADLDSGAGGISGSRSGKDPRDQRRQPPDGGLPAPLDLRAPGADASGH